MSNKNQMSRSNYIYVFFLFSRVLITYVMLLYSDDNLGAIQSV